jgi:hypothetical protein
MPDCVRGERASVAVRRSATRWYVREIDCSCPRVWAVVRRYVDRRVDGHVIGGHSAYRCRHRAGVSGARRVCLWCRRRPLTSACASRSARSVGAL